MLMSMISGQTLDASNGRSAAGAAVVLAVALLLSPAPTASIARAADSISNIPGVPLQGAVSAGRLGGTIYDVVYRFTVAPGHVIVASLGGTAGTDFDLYLFDDSATTVLSKVGLVTKSAGPTSTESISWPSRLGGTFYIDLNGASNVEGDYRLTVQSVPDGTPPVASVVLAGGRGWTNQLTVPVTVVARDDLSGIAEMALSADGTTYTDWRPFDTNTDWTFQAGDGLRTIWVKVKNGVGLESAPATASVAIDTVSPSVIALDPAPGSTVSGLRPRLSVTFDEPIDPASWNELGLVVQSASGTLVGGAYAYDAPARTGSFVPAEGLQGGASYVVTVGNVTDIAGNPVTPPGSWSMTPLAATSLSVTATPSVLVREGSGRLEVTLTGTTLPTTLDVLSATGPTGLAPLTTITVEEGHASLDVAPGSNTTYRFHYAGAFGIAPADKDLVLLVRRGLVLAGRNSAAVASGRIGVPIGLTAQVSPSGPGVSVSFRLYRFDRGRRAWVYAGSHGRSTDAAGRATLTWVPTTPGSFYWRVSVASTPDFANNVSPVYRWSVTR